MSAQPQWESVDSDAADLLSLVADTNHPSPELEWQTFRHAVLRCARLDDGMVRPNRLRPLVRGAVAPRRIGAFTNRAKAEGLLVDAGEWEISDDHEGRNGGKPMRCYRIGAAA